MNNGKRDLSQIKQFVVDKGDWLSISKNNRAQIKAGLFIVEMPRSPDTAAFNKDVGTPLQRPLRTAHHHTNGDLGLEICSTNISEFLIASDDEEEEEDMEVQQLDDVTDDEQDVIMNGYRRRPSPLRHQHNGIHDDDDLASQMDGINSQQEDQIIGVGEGADAFSFLFRIIEAKCISTIIDDYSNIVAAYFEYTFADRCYQCNANVLDDCWQVDQHNTSAKFQGDAHDILEWIGDQEKIRVCLMVENDRGQVVEVGSADIYLKGRDVGVDQQSSIIFDNTHKWHINAKNEFAKVQVQIGLLEGWKEPDFFRPI
jgi:hypothetical protein